MNLPSYVDSFFLLSSVPENEKYENIKLLLDLTDDGGQDCASSTLECVVDVGRDGSGIGIDFNGNGFVMHSL